MFGLLVIFSFGVMGLLTLAALIAIGSTVGQRRAKAGRVPPLRPLVALGLVLCVSMGPLAAGYLEVAVRGAPFPLPDDRSNVNWKFAPDGASYVTFASEGTASELFEELLQLAEKEGWHCAKCQFPDEHGWGLARLRGRSSLWSSERSERAWFEVHSDVKPFSGFGLEPSEKKQAVVGHYRKNWSLELAGIAMFVLLVLGSRKQHKT